MSKLTSCLLRVNPYSCIGNDCTCCWINLKFFCNELHTSSEWSVLRHRYTVRMLSLCFIRKKWWSLRSEWKFWVWSICNFECDLLEYFLLSSWFLLLLVSSLWFIWDCILGIHFILKYFCGVHLNTYNKLYNGIIT